MMYRTLIIEQADARSLLGSVVLSTERQNINITLHRDTLNVGNVFIHIYTPYERPYLTYYYNTNNIL